jgi:flagellar motor switch protein FliM
VVLEEWCRLWGGGQPLTASVVGHENGGRYLQTSASDAAMLVVTLEGALGDCTERMQLAIPYGSVEGALRHLTAANLTEGADRNRPARRPGWSQAFNGIPIPLSVEWDACELSLREIVALQPGTVVRLSRDIIAQTHVRLGGATKFVGEVGAEDDRLAIRIDQKLSSEEV